MDCLPEKGCRPDRLKLVTILVIWGYIWKFKANTFYSCVTERMWLLNVYKVLGIVLYWNALKIKRFVCQEVMQALLTYKHRRVIISVMLNEQEEISLRNTVETAIAYLCSLDRSKTTQEKVA